MYLKNKEIQYRSRQ